MRIAAIAAVSLHGVIGAHGGGLPWHLPRDVARFRAFTAGRPVLLGRKTYEEMIGWFVTATPIVLTRQSGYQVPGGYVVATVPAAIALAQSLHAERLVVAGGAATYLAALLYCQEIHRTLVATEVPGAARFPSFAHEEWALVHEEAFPADAENAFGMTFQTWARRVQPVATGTR